MKNRCTTTFLLALSFALICFVVLPIRSSAQENAVHEKIVIDTDIGGDIDDTFAVGLALESPEFESRNLM